MKVRTLMLFIFLLVAGPVSAGWFEDTLTNAMKRVTERGIDDAADGAYEAGKDAVTQEEEEKPKKEKKKKQKAPAADEETSSESGDEDMDEESKE